MMTLLMVEVTIHIIRGYIINGFCVSELALPLSAGK